MATQGLSVYENASTPATPAAGYRALYPVATGWKELDSAGNARFFAKLDADNVSLTLAGNLTFSAASPRIKWANSATVSERLFFQTSTTDANTVFHAMPNGTATQSSLALHNSSNTTNYTRLFLSVTATAGQIQTGNFGSGTALPLELISTGVTGISIATTGYVTIPTGLNVGTATGAVTGQIRTAAANTVPTLLTSNNFVIQSVLTNNHIITDNLYFNGTNWKYLANGYGSYVQQTNGEFWFGTAANNVSGAEATATPTSIARIGSAAAYFYGGLNVGSGTGATTGNIAASAASDRDVLLEATNNSSYSRIRLLGKNSSGTVSDWRVINDDTASTGLFTIYGGRSGSLAVRATIDTSGITTFTGGLNVGTVPFANPGSGYIQGPLIAVYSNALAEYGTNADAPLYVNYDGYALSTTQFRDLWIGNGKRARIALFDGSASTLTVDGGLNVGTASGATTGRIYASDAIYNSGYIWIYQTWGSRYRTVLQTSSNSSNLTCYDDTGAVYIPLTINASQVYCKSGFYPTAAGTYNLGDATYYWNDVSYKTLTDRGCLFDVSQGVHMQDGTVVSSVEVVRNKVKKHPTKKSVQGRDALDYSALPVDVYKPAPIATEDVYETDAQGQQVLKFRAGEKMGEDGAEMSALMSITLGALREILNTIDAQQAEIVALKAKVK